MSRDKKTAATGAEPGPNRGAAAGVIALQTKAPVITDRGREAGPHPRVHRCAQNIFERFRADANVRERRRCSGLLPGASVDFSLEAAEGQLGPTGGQQDTASASKKQQRGW